MTEIDASDADTWYFLGTTYAQLKQFPQAIDAFKQALKIDPLHASAEFGLSRALQQSGDTAQSREHLVKFQHITHDKLGSPISLAYGEQGKYSRAEESPSVVEKVPAQIAVKFVSQGSDAHLVTKAAKSEVRDMASYLGGGACFLDYDGDGQLDVLLADGVPSGELTLFRGVNGKFEDVSKTAGIASGLHALGCTVGDYDNDGFADVALTTSVGVMLLHNEKGAGFKDVTQSSGVSTRYNVGLTFIDYDHDGDLDLFVTDFQNHQMPQSVDPLDSAEGMVSARLLVNHLFRNNGNGTFTFVENQGAIARLVPSVSAVGSDYNNDRAIDIIVTAWRQAPGIFVNPREGEFPMQRPWQASMPQTASGIAVLDFNHDGWMDVAFTHWATPSLTLWRNDKAKTFEQVPLPQTNWAVPSARRL